MPGLVLCQPGRSLLPGLLPQPPAIQTTPTPPLYWSSSRPDPVAPPVTSFADNLKPWESSPPLPPPPEEIGWATTLGHTVHIGCLNENFCRCTNMEYEYKYEYKYQGPSSLLAWFLAWHLIFLQMTTRMGGERKKNKKDILFDLWTFSLMTWRCF